MSIHTAGHMYRHLWYVHTAKKYKFSYLFTARQRDVSGISGVVSAQFQSGSGGRGRVLR